MGREETFDGEVLKNKQVLKIILKEEIAMSMTGYQAFLIAPDTWAIHETESEKRIPDSPTFYLLAGSRQGLLIDTGDGKGGVNLRDYVQTLTNRPVRMVANTSVRSGYIGRDKDFKCVFASEQIYRMADIPEFEGRIVPVKAGYKIDIGERIVEVFDMDGYGKGCLSFLDHKERLLFTGESMVSTDEAEAYRGGILYDRETGSYGSLYKYMKNLAALLSRRTQYDLVCWGYGSDYPLDANVVEFTMNAVLHALEEDGVENIDLNVMRLPEADWRMKTYKYARVVFSKEQIKKK